VSDARATPATTGSRDAACAAEHAQGLAEPRGVASAARTQPRVAAGGRDEARVPTGAPRRVLVLGGTSEIAQAIVRELAAERPCEVALAGRDAPALATAAERLRDAGCGVHTLTLDAAERDGHRGAIAHGIDLLGGEIDLVLLAVGVLGTRGGWEHPRSVNVDEAVEVLAVNTLGAGSLLLESACALGERGHGTIIVLSSVAAERPRASNPVYCASKAGLDALARGLSDALAPLGIRVLVVRPGFVRTRMTRGLAIPPLASDPEDVARATVRGLRRGAGTVWAPAAMRWLMLVLRLLPRPLFRRLPL
jgi:decaprenylphospho-beta-D-erythro-pentofuranosid-2-ulose 2-reductase